MAAVVVIGSAWALRSQALGMAADGWYWLNKEYEAVAILAAEIDQPAFAAPGSNVNSVVDGTRQEFTMDWVPPTGDACDDASGEGWITLTIASTRIRRVSVHHGLDAQNQGRASQPIPRAVAIKFDGDLCTEYPLPEAEAEQMIDVDSTREVTEVQFRITALHRTSDDPTQTSLTEIVLLAHRD